MPKKSFSHLEKNEKTFKYIKMYYKAIEHNESLEKIDNEIHRIELADHLRRTKDTPEEKAKWISENAENMRAWLNSMKIITLTIYADNKRNYRTEVIQRVFYDLVDIWNDKKTSLIDSIRICGWADHEIQKR